MRRCAPAADLADDEGADPIPVAALLRREGRSAAGLPVVQAPAAGDVLSTLPAAAPAPAPRHDRGGRAARRGLGLRAHRRHERPRDPAELVRRLSRPGRTRPGLALGGVLDAGHAAPTSWLPVAFPTLFTGGRARQPAAAAGARRAAPVARRAGARPRRRRLARRARPLRSRTSGTTDAAAASSSGRRSDVGNTVGGVGHTVDDVGDTVGDLGKDTPLQGVTDTVGDTVTGVGRQVRRGHRPGHGLGHAARRR